MCSLADSQTDVGPIIATSIPEFKEVELYPKAIESLSTSCDMTSVKPVLVTEVYTARKLAGNPSDNAQQFRQADFRKSTAVDKVHKTTNVPTGKILRNRSHSEKDMGNVLSYETASDELVANRKYTKCCGDFRS